MNNLTIYGICQTGLAKRKKAILGLIIRYGFLFRMHREYLREQNPIRFDDLCLSGKLWTYLADLNEQAQDRLDTIIQQMKEAEGVTEDLKRTQQMVWVQSMNGIRNRAEEIVLTELIYS